MSYLHRVSFNEHGLQIEVGIYDPERWKQSVERGDVKPEQMGGMSFGESAGVALVERWRENADGRMEVYHIAEVSIGSIGSHDVATADRRIDVYTQARDMAQFINAMLAEGEEIVLIGKFLDAALAQDPLVPAEKPFKYKGDPGLYPALGELVKITGEHEMERRDRYYLQMTALEDELKEVTREQWINSERSAGFRPKGGGDGPATGGFSGHGIRGTVATEWSFDGGVTWETPSTPRLNEYRQKRIVGRLRESAKRD